MELAARPPASFNSMPSPKPTENHPHDSELTDYIIEGDSAQYYYNRHPATYYANVGGAQAWLDSYIQILRTVAAEKSVNLVDVRAACDNYNRYDFLRSLLNAANTDDGVHPHLIGSSLYAQLIGDYLAARY